MEEKIKLKTLKDINISEMLYESNETSAGASNINQTLKQEAIKWYHRSDDNKHKFIREFFKITKKELK